MTLINDLAVQILPKHLNAKAKLKTKEYIMSQSRYFIIIF